MNRTNLVPLEMNLDTLNVTDIASDSEQFIADHVYVSIGVFMIIVFICGFFQNCGVLCIYSINKKLWTCRNIFLIGLAVGDVGQSVLNIPFVIISAFSKQWIFGHQMCQYYGFVTSMFGLTQITILTVIALDRYLIIVRHRKLFSQSKKTTICTILLCFTHGALWSSGPLFGWSQYIMDAGNISCGIDWNLQDVGNQSFVISLFVFVWFIPLGLISFSYTSIAYLVVRERKKKKTLTSSRKQKKTSKERRVAVTCFIVSGFFVLTWTPYSIVSFWTALDHIDTIPILVQMSTAFFAKSSIIWNPVIYFLRHDNFRSACTKTLPCFQMLRKKTHGSSKPNDSSYITTHNRTAYKTELTTDIRNALIQTNGRKQSISDEKRETII